MENFTEVQGTLSLVSNSIYSDTNCLEELIRYLDSDRDLNISLSLVALGKAVFNWSGYDNFIDLFTRMLNEKHIAQVLAFNEQLNLHQVNLNIAFNEFEHGGDKLRTVRLSCNYSPNNKMLVKIERIKDYFYSNRNIFNLGFGLDTYDFWYQQEKDQFKQKVFLPFINESKESVTDGRNIDKIWSDFLNDVCIDPKFDGVLLNSDFEDEDRLYDLIFG